TWNKGLDLLVRAFAVVKSRGRAARLVIKDQRALYGASLDYLLRTVQRAFPSLLSADVLSSIVVIGDNLPQEKLRLLFGAADCYVSPYRAEGFNLPVLEAIACGTPAIVTAGGATDDYCNDAVAV